VVYLGTEETGITRQSFAEVLGIRDERTSVSCSFMKKSLAIWVDRWDNRGISMLSTVSGHCSIECGAHRPVHLMLSNQHALIAHVKMLSAFKKLSCCGQEQDTEYQKSQNGDCG